IDANGILKVSAKNLSTNKEQNITIKASGGLTEEEIKKMVKDAELNAVTDKKFKELVTVKNQADAIIHSTEKALKKVEHKINAQEKEKIENAIKELKNSMLSENKNDIENKINDLTQISQTLSQEIYKEEEKTDANDKDDKKKNDSTSENVVDADYEEIKEKDEKKNKKNNN
ncbi:MAG: Hsp70 family protein, partial [Deltaproteobacteria bacterium]